MLCYTCGEYNFLLWRGEIYNGDVLFMKRKIIKATILFLMSISIAGCKSNISYNEESLFETDIIGEWRCQMQDNNQYLKFDETICTYEQIDGIYEYKNYSINELNHDISVVEIDSWQLDKFYNILGNYYELDIEIPNSETFELNFEHWGTKYAFADNGILSVEYDEYIPSKTINYYRKENIIFDEDTKKVLFYIVEGGIFSPQYYKVK